jgi:lipopolysaccharide heptosyltransferase III
LAARALAPHVAAPRPRVERVLLLRPDHVGDVLLTAPAVDMLRKSLLEARFIYLVGPWSAAAVRNGPAIDEIRTLEFPGFTRRANTSFLAPYLLLVRLAMSLRREQYDVAVVLRADHWWGALLALAAGIPMRVGGDTPETRPLLTHASPSRADTPWGEQALEIARMAILAARARPAAPDRSVQFTPGEAARSTADQLWTQHGLPPRRVVGVHPSAGAPLKSWPIRRWAHLADALIERKLGVVLIGAPEDAHLLAAIAREMHGCVPILCGQSLEVSAAIYARCALVISVDSGAGHLAAAVGAPTVRLYGPAPPMIFGPWPQRAGQRVLKTDALACIPCGDLDSPPCGARSSPACLLALRVEDVLNAVRRELEHG